MLTKSRGSPVRRGCNNTARPVTTVSIRYKKAWSVLPCAKTDSGTLWPIIMFHQILRRNCLSCNHSIYRAALLYRKMLTRSNRAAATPIRGVAPIRVCIPPHSRHVPRRTRHFMTNLGMDPRKPRQRLVAFKCRATRLNSIVSLWLVAPKS